MNINEIDNHNVSQAFRNDTEIVMAAANNDRRAFRFASVWAREEVSENFKEQLAPFLVDVVALRSHVSGGVVLKLPLDIVPLLLRCLDCPCGRVPRLRA